MIRFSSIVVALGVAAVFAGCTKEKSSSASKNPPAVVKADEHDHEHAGGHEDEGPMIELGTATAGGWTVKASRTEGNLTAGGETAVDCTVTGGSGTVSAVRCWIGTEDAKGAIKALADIENSADPSHRHAHVEVPSPIADGSKLWVEVEDSSGAKSAASFDLKK
jgi:hypothetical protein